MGIKIDLKTNTMLKLHVVAAVSCVIYDRNSYIYIYICMPLLRHFLFLVDLELCHCCLVEWS